MECNFGLGEYVEKMESQGRLEYSGTSQTSAFLVNYLL
jgi:hypothetical protein